MLQNGMPYRILPNGVIETDSLAEALEVQTALTGKKPPRHRGGAATPRSSNNDVLNLKAKTFLSTLLAAPVKGLTTERAAKAVGVDPKGLPPVIRSLNSWCRKHQVVMDKMVTRETAYDANRRALSVYKFTDEGRVFFAGRPELASVVANGAGGKTTA